MPTAMENGPCAEFNFAHYLIELNAGHPAKTAYIDDRGSLSYGELGTRIRKLAAALLGLGIRREERVLLLMQDNEDWPVAFLGSMYAGIVPVAVNTLLTADDYAYMLQNSRAQAVMYWGNRGKTRETFQGAWTKSGDKYVRSGDGYYTYAGRSDDMLKVSGIYVSPFEVEATLMMHPAVLECAVIGVEDGEGLLKTKAFVVLQSGQKIDEASLKAFVKDHLAPYKYPRFIEFVDELPKTATGKIQRFRLREQERINSLG